MPGYHRKGKIGRRLKKRSVSSVSSKPRPGVRQRIESDGRAAEDPVLDVSSDDEGLFLDCDDDFGAVISDDMRRTSIATTFVEIFDAPPECEWAGRDGTVSAIMRHLKMKPGSRDVVLRVLRDVIECHKAGVRYDPARKFGSGGHNKLIKMGSVEEQLVADLMESGLSLTQTMYLVNLHRRGRGLGEVGRSAVHSASLRLCPVRTAMPKRKQGPTACSFRKNDWT